MPKLFDMTPCKYKDGQKVTYSIGLAKIQATVVECKPGGKSSRGKVYPAKYRLKHESGAKIWRSETVLTPA